MTNNWLTALADWLKERLPSSWLPDRIPAHPFEVGLQAYWRHDYPTALREFRVAADQGIAEAQFNLGAMYEKGEGVTQDMIQAAALYLQAAEHGHGKAKARLAALDSFVQSHFVQVLFRQQHPHRP